MKNDIDLIIQEIASTVSGLPILAGFRETSAPIPAGKYELIDDRKGTLARFRMDGEERFRPPLRDGVVAILVREEHAIDAIREHRSEFRPGCCRLVRLADL